MTISMMTFASPLGPLSLYSQGDELVGLYLPTRAPVIAATQRPCDVLAQTAKQLTEYFAGKRTEFALPLGGRGTGFQELVWRALIAIPFGTTCSYGQLASAIGRPSASRAVGAANGKNPISIIVPCHRVIGASGELTGYGGGMPAKRWLLDHEQRIAMGSARAAC